MAVSAGQILSAARLNAQFATFQASIDAKTGGFAKAKSGDTSRASTTAFADDPHLTFQGVANAVYNVFIHINFQAPVTPSIKFQFVFPSGTWKGTQWEYAPGTGAGAGIWQPNPTTGAMSSASPAAIVIGLTGSATNNWPMRVAGRLALGVTGGTCALQWAQNVSNASATILREGSWLNAIQVN